MWPLWLFLQVALPTSVPGTAMTYTDGANVWAGSPFCAAAGALLSPGSPAIDAGEIIPGYHCPLAGSSQNQPRQADGSPCAEWYGTAPDAGACEFVQAAQALPSAPLGLTIEMNPSVGGNFS